MKHGLKKDSWLVYCMAEARVLYDGQGGSHLYGGGSFLYTVLYCTHSTLYSVPIVTRKLFLEAKVRGLKMERRFRK